MGCTEQLAISIQPVAMNTDNYVRMNTHCPVVFYSLIMLIFLSTTTPVQFLINYEDMFLTF